MPGQSQQDGHASQGGECPVAHATARDAFAEAARAGCPMHEEEGTDTRHALNPLNAMPAPDQTQGPGQKAPLSTIRAVSSIPRAPPTDGTATPSHQANMESGNWVYPSQQMFYNAMKRKGWNPEEETMPAIIAIHNQVNERCWNQILAYESLHTDVCCEPKLVRFRGRYNEPTPKARFMELFGFKAFDRHDWIIDRCGEEVRYVIDYYRVPGAETETEPARDGGHVGAPSRGVHIDARPALDSFGSAVDRARITLRKLLVNF